jgi:NAD(P)-dependent dehydrogenase (short-subunit alcohol dehydrogenase family)
VTGGASGIGRSTASRRTAAGCRVAVLDPGDAGESDAELALRTDVTDPRDVETAVKQIVAVFGSTW